MTKTELTRRAKFYAEYLFGFKTIPDVRFANNKQIEDSERARAETLGIYWKRESDINGMFCASEYGTGRDNECRIILNSTLLKTEEDITQTLIHELLHYVLWWQGYESHDGDPDFENRLKELGLPSDYDVTWNEKNEVVRKPADAEKLKMYITAYHLASDAEKKGEVTNDSRNT